MKKQLLIVTVLSLSSLFALTQSSAQSPKVYPITLDGSSTPANYALAKTTIVVSVIVERESIRTGPYARFAQKYLGVVAPLTDKDIYTIRGARVDYTDPDREAKIRKPQNYKSAVVSHVYGGSEFTKVTPDRMTMVNKSLEDMAKDAVNSIFNLRKRRLELVSGEAGEHVYGAGLKAAINELLRMESELLALFLGKQTTTTSEKIYEVVPERGQSNYILFRFSQTEGLLSEHDLSASPVLMVLDGDNIVDGMVGPKRIDRKREIYYQVARLTKCQLISGSEEVAVEYLPIYQLGEIVTAPRPLD